jgi:hypothetical protein
VYSDFRAFFADSRNAQAVYRPSAGARFEIYHSIVLVSAYNDIREIDSCTVVCDALLQQQQQQQQQQQVLANVQSWLGFGSFWGLEI